MSKPPTAPTLADVKKSIGRELGLRKAVYAKPGSRMSEAEKAHEIACMEEAYRILEVVGKLRARILASQVVNDLATLVKHAGTPQDAIVQRHALGAHHHIPQISEIIASEIMNALK